MGGRTQHSDTLPTTTVRKNLGKLSILSIKTWLYYKNGVFDAKTAHHSPMSGQDPD